jgi:hypothetical protein
MTTMPQLSRDLTAAQPLNIPHLSHRPYRNSGVGAYRNSAVTIPHLSREPRLSCRRSTDIEHGFFSSDFKPSAQPSQLGLPARYASSCAVPALRAPGCNGVSEAEYKTHSRMESWQ